MIENTMEQEVILGGWLRSPVVIIEAGPGCGKSTTCGMMASSLPSSEQPKVLGTAFNRDIVYALAKKLPSRCDVRTLNGIGHMAWETHRDAKSSLNAKKTREMLKHIQDDGRWSISPEEFEILINLVNMAKAQGYLPPATGSAYKSLISFHDLCLVSEIRAEPHYEKLLNETLSRSIKAAYKGDIDFEDQCYVSTFFASGTSFPSPEYLFVDEAQDLSPLQLLMVKRIKAKHRIFVGDPKQAIYAFRGAMSDSFEKIREMFPEHVVYPLLRSFRLPSKVVSYLQSYNPRLTPGKQDQGTLEVLSGTFTMLQMHEATWDKSRAILCRNNAPLYRVALACIASRVRFQISNPNFGKGLISDIRRVIRNLASVPADELPDLMARHWFKEDMDGKEFDAMCDKVATLACLANYSPTAETVVKMLSTLLTTQNLSDKSKPFVLATGHKAKGLEFDWVMHLDPGLIPAKFATKADEVIQEHNIAYVINSRTLHTLLFANSEQILIPGATQIRHRPKIGKDIPL